MRVGDLVRFKPHENEKGGEWRIGLLIRYDKLLKVGEILVGEQLFYAPGRLIEVHQRGLK